MDRDLQVKLAVYRQFAETGRGPSPVAIADRVGPHCRRGPRRIPAPPSPTGPRARAGRRVDPNGTPVFRGGDPARRRRRGRVVLRQLCLGRPRHSRRPQPKEMREIFSHLGLAGDFWDPESDDFGQR